MTQNILDFIGNTPLLNIEDGIFAKAEFLNPSGSLKARMAHYLIEKAEQSGDLKPGDTIVEATSGSTGNALSLVGAVKGYKVLILIPEGYSHERKQISERLGAEIRHIGHIQVNACHEEAIKLGQQDGYFCPQQFDNELNVQGHFEWLGPEIIKQIPKNVKIDAIVQGVGTGGTIIGVGKALREYHNPDLKIYVVEPSESPIISKGIIADHKIEGIADGWVPSIIERHKDMIDGYIEISSDDAIEETKSMARKTGLFVGPTSGANMIAARNLKNENTDIQNVVTFLCDKGEKYLTAF